MSDQESPPPVRQAKGSFGPNAWLVDDMYEQFRSDPSSVSDSWRDFFADYVPPRQSSGSYAASTVETVASPAPGFAGAVGTQPGQAPVVASAQTAVVNTDAVALRGAAARIVSNMEASLAVPTATSVRTMPAKLLQVNRSLLNQYLARSTGAKVSFTHLIAYAIVKALGKVTALNAGFVDDSDGKKTPGVIRHPHVGLGLAVDLTKSDGTHTLMVPVIRDADTLDFRTFVLAYEDLVRKVHSGKVSPDDFAGATVTLTNPGTLGTVQSVPRLMPGQGAIIGVGSLGLPAEYQGADPRSISALGIGPVLTITSTYDHRIIQGAESGLFLSYVAECLLGKHDFYDDVFAAMEVATDPVRWQPDRGAVSDNNQLLAKQVHVENLINMFRVRGHLIADLDPLSAEPPLMHPELDPNTYGLSLWDFDREWVVGGLAGKETMNLGEALDILRDSYCRTLGIEYMHIQDPLQKRWIQQQVEGAPEWLSAQEKREVLDRLNAAEAFERFLHSRYVGQKRFGLEGAESTIVLLATVLDEAASSGLDEAVIGMSHRGRLNVLANIVGKSYGEIFREFEGNLDPESVQGSGDVKYHKGATGKFFGQSGHEIPVTLSSNPSHLEAVDPVVEGMVRAKQDQIGPSRPFSVLSVLLHGDAAFAGQGVVAETLELSQLAGYRTGGTVHIVINNQLGFTTLPESARSSVYPTDVAKMVQAPIFHVNGDDPEACARAARLAFGFRQAFHKDVVIDLVCYRRHGHNEGDDPSYTQPLMYAIIEAKRSVRKLYTEALVRRGDITLEEAEQSLQDFQNRLQLALDETRQTHAPVPLVLPPPNQLIGETPSPQTGVDEQVLKSLVVAATQVPEGFTVHPKLVRQFDQRSKVVAEGEIDWALGEALAFGSLVLEGTDVRVAGQDTRRGTFSHRHAVLVDHENGSEWIPLSHLQGDRLGRFEVHDSLLSEYAAVGFEYGYTVESPDSLVAWEAQFGDFSNGAQIIIDNFIAAAEDKWGQHSGLVLLLPHGYEGQGPEHSSARIERFLTLAACDNIRITQPTTAAQYFHMMRSQVRGVTRRPLIVFTPKSLLRARQSRSPIADLASGSFQTVLDDPFFTQSSTGVPASGDASSVQRVILCSGKGAFEVIGRRAQLIAGTEGLPNPDVDPSKVAVVRIEQLYPWPETSVKSVLSRYPNAQEFIWFQEEPENMGPWGYVQFRLIGGGLGNIQLGHITRAESASPASGSAALHQLELDDLLAKSFR